MSNELANLVHFLEEQREIFRRKAGGLGHDDLMRTLPPSDLTLGGMVKHLAFVEDWWFGRILCDDQADLWATVDWAADPDWDWHSATDDTPDELWALWEAAVARSQAAVEQRPPARARGRSAATGRDAVHAALDPRPHGHGVRPAPRPRRPGPAVHRRAGGRHVDIRLMTVAGLAAGVAVLRRDRAGRRDLRLPHRPHLRAGPRALDHGTARPDRRPRGGAARDRALHPRQRDDGPQPAGARRATSAPRRSWSPRRHAAAASAAGWGSTSCSGTASTGFRGDPVQRGRGDQHRRRAPVAGARLPDHRDRAGSVRLSRARAGRAARHAPRAGLALD